MRRLWVSLHSLVHDRLMISKRYRTVCIQSRTLLRRNWRSNAIVRFVCQSCCHSFVLSASRITDERGIGWRQNMVNIGRGDPLEVVKFWCWSEFGCGCRISVSLSLILGDTKFYDVIRQRATLQWPYHIRRFILSHHRATMRRHWRSLRSLSALVTLNNNNNNNNNNSKTMFP